MRRINQRGRRNLTVAQRIRLATLREPLLPGRRQRDNQHSELFPNSEKATNRVKASAELAGVGRDTYAKGKAILKAGLGGQAQRVN